jgi:hypothetical protein
MDQKTNNEGWSINSRVNTTNNDYLPIAFVIYIFIYIGISMLSDQILYYIVNQGKFEK